MNNETVGQAKSEGKAGLTAATLPWWAKVLIAQHCDSAFPMACPHQVHHCSHCGCVLISTRTAYRFSSGVCLECGSRKNAPKGGF